MNTDPISTHRVLVEGISTLYYEAGEGPVLLLVHGNITGPRSWYRTMTEFMSTHRVVALALPGYGGTSPVEDISPAGLASFLAAFLDKLSIDKVIAVGHSAGGLIVATFALQYPRRVTRLVLADSAGLGRAVNPSLIAASVMPMWAVHTMIAALQLPGAAIVRAAVSGTGLRRPWAVRPKEWLDQIRQTQSPTVLLTSYRTVRLAVGVTGQQARHGVARRLANLEIPTLVVWGLTDEIFPVWQGIAAARRLPRGRLAILANAGHIGYMDNHIGFIAAVSPFVRDDLAGDPLGKSDSRDHESAPS
ncbi:alpha/beta fold hydrolase [Nocardia goodfellowii]